MTDTMPLDLVGINKTLGYIALSTPQQQMNLPNNEDKYVLTKYDGEPKEKEKKCVGGKRQ